MWAPNFSYRFIANSWQISCKKWFWFRAHGLGLWFMLIGGFSDSWLPWPSELRRKLCDKRWPSQTRCPRQSTCTASKLNKSPVSITCGSPARLIAELIRQAKYLFSASSASTSWSIPHVPILKHKEWFRTVSNCNKASQLRLLSASVAIFERSQNPIPRPTV